MARNYEKNFGKLNRLWLDKETVRREKRPKLSSLKTSAEISQWLPSIKIELDFYLKQMEVPCYTEQKIGDCRKHIRYLEAEYKAFVRKLHHLNSALKATPWTARPYEKKLKGDPLSFHPMGAQSSVILVNALPVLMHDELYQEGTRTEDDMSNMQNSTETHMYPGCSNDLPLFHKDVSEETSEPRCNKGSASDVQIKSLCSEACDRKQNALGLSYSSSDDDT